MHVEYEPFLHKGMTALLVHVLGKGPVRVISGRWPFGQLFPTLFYMTFHQATAIEFEPHVHKGPEKGGQCGR